MQKIRPSRRFTFQKRYGIESRLSVPCGPFRDCGALSGERKRPPAAMGLFFLLCTTACAFSASFSPSTSAPRQERAHRLRLSADEINPGAVAGTNLRILEYPHPLLRAPNADVTEFDDELKQLTKEMFDIMYASRGVGLAAPQLGINKRLMVFNPEGDPKKWLSELVLCNPEIEEYSTSTALEEEGCLSFPGFTADAYKQT